MLLDLSIMAISFLLAFLLRFNFEITDFSQHNFTSGLLVYLACWLFSSVITGSYTGIIRYTGLQDGVRLLYSSSLAVGLIIGANLIANYFELRNIIPYSVVLIAFFTSYLFLFAYRLAVKYTFAYFKTAVKARNRVLIFGAGQSGVITKQVIDSDSYSKQRVVGFMEDDEQKAGKTLNGTPIYYAAKQFEYVLQNQPINEVIISIKNLSLKRKNEIVDICLKHDVKVSAVPPVEKWVKGELSIKQIKEVRIEDLLSRESINIKNENLNKEFVNKVILVTGAAGSIGSEIVRQLINYGPKAILLVDQSESALYEIERAIIQENKLGIRIVGILDDITNRSSMNNIFSLYRPNIVFHAAAYKHVPMMENNPTQAVGCNIIGSKILADLAVTYDVEKFVMVSTDKAVNPTNVMGCSKRIAEMYVQSLDEKIRLSDNRATRFITTRFGNVLGSNGSVIPYFKKQIAAGGPITVTHPEITRYFMTIPEACQLVLEAGAMGIGGEIMIFDMGESIKIVDLAKKMIRLSGMEVGKDIDIVYTGLRDGEKLYEELLSNTENCIPTYHDKIMIAKVDQKSFVSISHDISKLQEALDDNDELELVYQMKQIVPEFISNSSRFEMLDNR